MNFSLVFENSGDTIPLIAINPEVVEYYVEQINQHGLNNFWCHPNKATSIIKYCELLRDTSKLINDWLAPLTDNLIPVFDNDEDYLDQYNLNYIHALWVHLHSFPVDIDKKRVELGHSPLIELIHNSYPDSERFPTLSGVVCKIDKQTLFDSLNKPLIHGLEDEFGEIKFRCSDKWVEFSNPFPKKIVTLDTCNFFLPFNHLGRTQYDKFLHYDLKLEHQDENTFDQLLGLVEFNLCVPETNTYSKEYSEWCKMHSLVPTGNLIPLGNIPDLATNLKNYRIILLRNLKSQNKFQINLNKG